MKIILLILELLVASMFIIAAILKLMNSFRLKQEDSDNGIFASVKHLRLVSFIEIAASFLLVLPSFIGEFKVLTIIGSLTLIFIIVGAPIFHIKAGEHKEAAFTSALLFILVFITFYQFFG
jgi:uncharacterized membrane protein YphA (DoxX/SURF4 family)